MAITFLCPNGHKLSCPRELAGRPGQCPECGVQFQIPEPEVQASAAPAPAAAPSVTEPHPDQIVFLCPNGHRLHGPSSLAGKAGQCPHCGAKFLIPELAHDEQAPDPGPVEEEIPLDSIEHIDDDAVESAAESAASEPAEADDIPQFDFAVFDQSQRTAAAPPLVIDVSEAEQIVAPAVHSHPLAQLLEQLWNRQSSEATIEVRLQSGETLVPHFYAAETSRRSHAFFAVREPNGRHSVIAVPWESVTRVTVRGLDRLPAEFL